MTEFYYRVYDQHFSDFSIDGDLTGWGRTQIEIMRLPVFKRTKKGVWVGYDSEHDRHFCLDGEGKRYAYPTPELAMKSFLRRKARQQYLLNRTLRRSKEAQELAEKWLAGDRTDRRIGRSFHYVEGTQSEHRTSGVFDV